MNIFQLVTQQIKVLIAQWPMRCPVRRLQFAGCPWGSDPMAMSAHDDMPQSSATPVRSPRQEEKWQEREAPLLDLTHHILEEEGFAGFNMERLVKASDVSKGTVYNHFSSKEDCLAALCIRGMHSLADMFRRARAFDGTSREKALAIHFAYRLHLKMHPTLSMSLISARTASFAEKTSPERAEKLRQGDSELFVLAFEVIQDAARAGDLELTDDMQQVVITFLNWSVSYGINMLASTGFDPAVSQMLEEKNIALMGANVLLDGIGMKPLSKDWDYRASWDRIARELFADEIRLIAEGASPANAGEK